MEILTKILDFLEEIEIAYSLEQIDGSTFLPGLKLREGRLVIDVDKLTYPGDILHEAGHLATLPPDIRVMMSDDLGNDQIHQGGELMAIAWSYAVCTHLKIDPYLVFHEKGYKGGGQSIVENFNEGKYFGVPLMEWYGMTYTQKRALELGTQPFPAMITWICKTKETSFHEST